MDGCAQGYSATAPDGFADALGSVPADNGTAGDNGGAGTSADAGAGMGTGPTTADQCARGETDVCTCESTQTEGDRACVADKTSPTGGYFGPCENCDAMTPASGGTGGAGAGTGGTGGAGTGGTAGTTPKPPVTPSAGCTGMPTMCTGFLACCKPDGKCGIGLAPLCL
jgi:hypothetical protein